MPGAGTPPVRDASATSGQGAKVRLAELVGALSLATDHAAGLAEETALRTAVLATEFAGILGLDATVRGHVYYTALLRFIGCTAYAPELARVAGGDDLALLATLTPTDTTHPAEALGRAFRATSRDRGPLAGARLVGRLVARPALSDELGRTHCELALQLAPRLGVAPEVVQALAHLYARFDGRGVPRGVRGEAIALPARLLHLAFRAEVHRRLEGVEGALAVVRDRAGGELDPTLARRFGSVGAGLLERVAPESVWERFLEAEPAPPRRVAPGQLRSIAEAFAHFADVKSTYTVTHSTSVARLARAVGERLGLSEERLERLEVAALLHDLGRTAVPNGIWDKPGPLSPRERERMRQHVEHTRRILELTPLLAPHAELASADHERTDGSGYPRRVTGTALGREARLLAACDMACALAEARPHRPALAPEAAARLLREEADGGRLDREAVEAVLAATGLRALARPRGTLPARLSEREAEVLRWVALGLSSKEIAARLFISAKTVQHHITHIHQKTGTSSRAAAAVFALRHGLLE